MERVRLMTWCRTCVGGVHLPAFAAGEADSALPRWPTVGGGSGSDSINAGSGNDSVSGSSGNDRIVGSSGNDRINGGSGNDRLFGGSGNDKLSRVW